MGVATTRWWSVVAAALATGAGAACGAWARDPAPPPVAAPDPFPTCAAQPSPQDVAIAKQAHQVASYLYANGRHEAAVAVWRASYDLDCTAHRLLINISHAYRKQGNTAAARHALTTYLERAGEDEADPEARKALEALEGETSN